MCIFTKGINKKPIRCPVCSTRLCDARISRCKYIDVIPIENPPEGDIIIKCKKCGKLVGLAIK